MSAQVAEASGSDGNLQDEVNRKDGPDQVVDGRELRFGGTRERKDERRKQDRHKSERQHGEGLFGPSLEPGQPLRVSPHGICP